MNYETLTWSKGIWRDFLNETYLFVWEHLQPENNPDTYYVIITDSNAKVSRSLGGYKRLVVILDDFAKSWRLPPDAPDEVIYLWYGLDFPPPSWQGKRKWKGGLHFWDAVPFEVPEVSRECRYEVFLCGNTKRERAKRLKHLLTGVSVSCVGFDWGEYFPVAQFRKREGELHGSVELASRECATELVYHSPTVKSFLSLRLPNILRRGNVPLVDLDHDPKRLLLITDKLRGNLYADNPDEVRAACRFAKEVTCGDLQAEYDAQVERAIADMAKLRGFLAETL